MRSTKLPRRCLSPSAQERLRLGALQNGSRVVASDAGVHEVTLLRGAAGLPLRRDLANRLELYAEGDAAGKGAA